MRVVPAETLTNEEQWHREIAEPRVRDVHDVVAARWRSSTNPWRVNVYVMQGNLLNVLNHRSREDLGDPTHSNQDDVTIRRYEWAERLATRMGAELCARGSLHIAGFGSLCIVEGLVEYDDPPRRTVEKGVRWTMSEALRHRLAVASAR
jgi:hypothetical protein